MRRNRLERLSNLGALTRFTFASLQRLGRGGNEPSFGEAFDAARQFAEDPDGWMVFTGPSGSGKTHLAAAIANRRIELGGPALFMVAPDLLDHLRASYDAEEGELGFDQLFDHIRNAPLLLLDDIDASAGTPWAKEKLLQVVNHRYNTRLATVFTTTLRPDQLDDRISTRLRDEGLSQVITLHPSAAIGYWQVGGMARERLAEMQFSDLVESSAWTAVERASFAAAVTVAREYAEDPYGWLVLLGANGCGKTHLAAAIANKALNRGRSVFFAVVPDLLDHLRKSFHPNSDAVYDDIFEQVRNADLLVLDDLGAHNSSPWADEKLYQIVNYRTVSRLPTVVTSDMDVAGLERTHPRIYARILDPHAGQRVEMLTPHYALGRSAGRREPPRRGPAR